MRQLIAFVCAIAASSIAFAGTSAGSGKSGQGLNALSSVWKSHSDNHLQTRNDLTIVYGGDDVSRPTFNLQSITA